MNIVILLSCFAITVSAVPARPQGEATGPQPDAQTPAMVEQPQPRVPQQAGPQDGLQVLPPTQFYPWSPLGGAPVMIPLQPSMHGPAMNQQTLQQQQQQQPVMLPPYTYFPFFSSPQSNQPFSQYGFPVILVPPPLQTPANQPPNSLVVPAETPSGPAGPAPQPSQQQQNPQIVYMLQQQMSGALGSVSSEELQMAANLGQLGVYLSGVLTGPSAGAAQPVNQAAGLTNPEQRGIAPTTGTSSVGPPQTQRPAGSGPELDTNAVPAGLERPTPAAATVQTPAEPELQPTQGNLA